MEKAVAEIMLLDWNRVRPLTVNLTFASKCDLILAYANELKPLDKDRHKEFTKIIEDIRSTYRGRNKYVHARWRPEGASLYRTSVRTENGKFSIEDEPTPIEDLYKTASDIAAVTQRFTELLQQYDILKS